MSTAASVDRRRWRLYEVKAAWQGKVPDVGQCTIMSRPVLNYVKVSTKFLLSMTICFEAALEKG
jgi:hypothetical protein